MSKSLFESLVDSRLNKAGIKINGPNPWDPEVDADHLSSFNRQVVWQGMLGLGNSFLDGEWKCADLSTFFFKAIQAGLLQDSKMSLPYLWKWIRDTFTNPQNRPHAAKNIAEHYSDADKEGLVLGMTDPKWNQYTCGFYADPTNPVEGLQAAQDRKLRVIFDKLRLEAGDTLLDVGMGWGGLLACAQQERCCRGMGVTLARNQLEYAEQHHGVQGLCTDYRSVNWPANRITAVGILEHIGPKNHRAFMEAIYRNLTADGIHLLHFFGRPAHNVGLLDPWTDQYIFPGLTCPTLVEVLRAADGLLELQHQEQFGFHYDPTLMAWYENFVAFAKTIGLDPDDRLYRMWKYYLLSCAGAFRAGEVKLYQLVFTKRHSRIVYSYPGTSNIIMMP
jgi:cyclopropane-fatty-acyl-phospholipid synthase